MIPIWVEFDLEIELAPSDETASEGRGARARIEDLDDIYLSLSLLRLNPLLLILREADATRMPVRSIHDGIGTGGMTIRDYTIFLR